MKYDANMLYNFIGVHVGNCRGVFSFAEKAVPAFCFR
jgi:hypothetical protein